MAHMNLLRQTPSRSGQPGHGRFGRQHHAHLEQRRVELRKGKLRQPDVTNLSVTGVYPLTRSGTEGSASQSVAINVIE